MNCRGPGDVAHMSGNLSYCSVSCCFSFSRSRLPTAYVQLFLDLCPTIKSYVENLCVVHLHENKL